MTCINIIVYKKIMWSLLFISKNILRANFFLCVNLSSFEFLKIFQQTKSLEVNKRLEFEIFQKLKIKFINSFENNPKLTKKCRLQNGMLSGYLPFFFNKCFTPFPLRIHSTPFCYQIIHQEITSEKRNTSSVSC